MAAMGCDSTLPEGAYADQGGTRAVVPGKPSESELLRRVTATDPDERMPPNPPAGKLHLTKWS